MHWHDHIDTRYIGPHFGAPETTNATRGVACASPRPPTLVEPWRDIHRAMVRSAYEASILKRQRLFEFFDLATGEAYDGPIDFARYHPIMRPCLSDVLASYCFALRLSPDEVLRP